jgi:hypothetical protein
MNKKGKWEETWPNQKRKMNAENENSPLILMNSSKLAISNGR